MRSCRASATELSRAGGPRGGQWIGPGPLGAGRELGSPVPTPASSGPGPPACPSRTPRTSSARRAPPPAGVRGVASPGVPQEFQSLTDRHRHEVDVVARGREPQGRPGAPGRTGQGRSAGAECTRAPGFPAAGGPHHVPQPAAQGRRALRRRHVQITTRRMRVSWLHPCLPAHAVDGGQSTTTECGRSARGERALDNLVCEWLITYIVTASRSVRDTSICQSSSQPGRM